MVKLGYKQNNLLFTFGDSADREQARYSFQLEGLENVWHEHVENTSVLYANLFGGTYHFKVRNVHFPDKIASVALHIEEAFWQEPWFAPMIAAYGLLILGIIVYFFRVYHFRNEIRMQKVRNEIASDLHDDVGTTLSSITFLGELAKSKFDKKPEDIRPILEKIMAESKEMMQTMRGMVWTINPQNDNAEDFFDKVKAFSEAILGSKNMQLTFSVRGVEDKDLDLEAQRNLFLIFKESVVNIGRHSDATNVKIIVQREKDHLWILIKDNGKGFDRDSGADGNGLRNIKNRAGQIGGDLSVESESGKGTQIKMVIPIT